MGQGDVGPLGLATSLILVGVALAVSLGQQLRLEKELIWSVIRAFVQLIVMGFVLAWLLEPGRSTAFSWLWVAGMVVFAAWTVRNRAPEIPGLFSIALAALVAADRCHDGCHLRIAGLPDGGKGHRAARRHDDRQLARGHRARCPSGRRRALGQETLR